MQSTPPPIPQRTPPPLPIQVKNSSPAIVVLWLFITLILATCNAVLQYGSVYAQSHASAQAQGAAAFGVLFPAIVASLFLFKKNFGRLDRWLMVYSITAIAMLINMVWRWATAIP